MMDDKELLTVLKGLLSDTIKYANDKFKATNLALDNAYRQEPYGNEEDGHSKVIASDVYDTVESDMPSFARVFLGPTDVMKFLPLGPNDVEEADQKTKYANFLIRGQRDSFKILHDLLKEPGKALCSVATYGIEECRTPEYIFYEGLSEDEMALLVSGFEEDDDIDSVEVESQEKAKDGLTFNVRFRITRLAKKITISTVPPECFIMSRGARDKDTAMIVGHETTKTKGELVAEGYPRDVIKRLLPNDDVTGNQLKQNRFEEQGGYDPQSGYHWTADEVTIQTLYPLVDHDGDGIPERRMVVKCGQEILENEPYGHVPYAIFSQILEPHAAIGHSRGEQAARFQLEKTAIKRGLMDNIYEVNRPRIAVDDSDGSIDGGKVDLDDLLNHRIGGIIRTDGVPSQALLPIETPFIGDKALMVVQYLDSEKSVTLGNQLANQGLTSDNLYKETATRFEGVEEAQQAKIELVARVYAETGFRQLYEGVIWTAQHFQDTETEVMVLGTPLTVDPRKWRYEHYCQSQIGLGAGDSQQAVSNLGALIQQQTALITQGSPLSDWSKLYNSLADMTRMMGKPDPARYWNNPEMPQETMMAQLHNMEMALKQADEYKNTVGSMAEAEQAKAKASLESQLIKTAQEADSDKRNYELEMRKLALEEQKLQLDAIKMLAEVRNIQSETAAQELETQAVETGLQELLETIGAAANG